MPSALETLVKILKLEQDTDYQNKAVIGGLKSFAQHWSTDAHAQAKKPEHHVLVLRNLERPEILRPTYLDSRGRLTWASTWP